MAVDGRQLFTYFNPVRMFLWNRTLARHLPGLARDSRDRFARSAVPVLITKTHMNTDFMREKCPFRLNWGDFTWKQAEPKVWWPILDL